MSKQADTTESPDETQPVDVTPEARRIEPARTPAGDGGELGFVLDVPLDVRVEIGSARLRVGEVLQLDKGSVIELDRMAGDPADVLVNGRIVARGEITTIDDRLAVRLLEVAGRGVSAEDD